MSKFQKSDEELRDGLLEDFFLFVRVMFEHKNHREFLLSHPDSNESHFITLVRELYDVFLGKTHRLLINMPPGWAKSELVKMFVCWCMAHYPDSNHLYISYSHELAAAHTHSIKQTIMMPVYRHLFGVSIMRDSSAKDFFKTERNGAVAAFGSSGAITGRDAGLPGLERYSGAVIVDDIHKPDEVHSNTIREKVKRNFFETIIPRCRGPNVPIIVIGQRLHEDDLCAALLNGEDGEKWKHVVIKALDDAGNPRYPEMASRQKLQTMRESQPYVFYSQYQQNPIPAGGALFKDEDFLSLDANPDIIETFITADTAETDKTWNDKTVFSFWGIYKIENNLTELEEEYGLHWLDCVELHVEPKDLEAEFLAFWSECMEFEVKPKCAAIEKKSTGVTLCSVLSQMQGIKIIPVKRAAREGNILNSKTNRFIAMQSYIGRKLVTLPTYGKHTKMCIEHMTKITANDTHRWDDIADTCYDAIKCGLIDKTVAFRSPTAQKNHHFARTIANDRAKRARLRRASYGRN